MTTSASTQNKKNPVKLTAQEAIAELDARREAELLAEGQVAQAAAEIAASAAPRRARSPITAGLAAMRRWFDTHAQAAHLADETEQKVDWMRSIPFVILHLVCLGVIWVGWSPVAVAVCAFMYALRMFAITGFYHRYFSHRCFRDPAGPLVVGEPPPHAPQALRWA
jgi:hypothetical protein